MTYLTEPENPNNPDYNARTCYRYHGHGDEFDIVYNGQIVAWVTGDFKCEVWIDENGDAHVERLLNKPYTKRSLPEFIKGEKAKDMGWIQYPKDAPFYEEIAGYFLNKAYED